MPYINGKFYTEREVAEVRASSNEDEFDKFLVSGVVGALTGSSIVGAVVGGSLLGGLFGDMFEGTDDSIF